VLSRAFRLFRPSDADQRRRFFDAAAPNTAHVSVEAEGLTFIVSTSDEAPGARFFESRSRSEFRVLRRASDRIDARGVFVDVGANIGTTTLPALGYFERAIALEPVPANAALLRANVALNGLDGRVTGCEAACSSSRGEVTLRLSPTKSGGHEVRPVRPGEQTLLVPAVTLDDVVADEGLRPTDAGLVWMDVGGHEVDVLRGATTLLDARVPIVAEIRARTAPDIERLLAGRYPRAVDLRTEVDLPLEELSDYLGRLATRAGGSSAARVAGLIAAGARYLFSAHRPARGARAERWHPSVPAPASGTPGHVVSRGTCQDGVDLAMRMRGLEPPRAEAHTDLNRARLPIPPHPRGKAF
jgi:FkbM family methyltransferase